MIQAVTVGLQRCLRLLAFRLPGHGCPDAVAEAGKSSA